MSVRLLMLAILLAPIPASAADGLLFLSPARGEITLGESYEVEIRADSDGETITAVEADLTFPAASMMVEKISIEGSILSQWPTPPTFSNIDGTISFSGTGARFNGDNGLLVTITFTGHSASAGNIRFESGAMLAADARATNIITTMQSGLYTIAPRVTQSVAPSPSDIDEQSDIEPTVAGVTVEVPEIRGFDDRVSKGERITLQGSASPDTEVTVSLQYEDEAPVESIVRSTTEGSFTYVSPFYADIGTYRAWVASRGSEVLKSNEVIIRAERDGLTAAVASVGPVLGLALPYVFLLVVLGCVIGFIFNRSAKTRRV
jgi:hypothetical protein